MLNSTMQTGNAVIKTEPVSPPGNTRNVVQHEKSEIIHQLSGNPRSTGLSEPLPNSVVIKTEPNASPGAIISVKAEFLPPPPSALKINSALIAGLPPEQMTSMIKKCVKQLVDNLTAAGLPESRKRAWAAVVEQECAASFDAASPNPSRIPNAPSISGASKNFELENIPPVANEVRPSQLKVASTKREINKTASSTKRVAFDSCTSTLFPGPGHPTRTSFKPASLQSKTALPANASESLQTAHNDIPNMQQQFHVQPPVLITRAEPPQTRIIGPPQQGSSMTQVPKLVQIPVAVTQTSSQPKHVLKSNHEVSLPKQTPNIPAELHQNKTSNNCIQNEIAVMTEPPTKKIKLVKPAVRSDQILTVPPFNVDARNFKSSTRTLHFFECPTCCQQFTGKIPAEQHFRTCKKAFNSKANNRNFI